MLPFVGLPSKGVYFGMNYDLEEIPIIFETSTQIHKNEIS